MVTCNVCFKNYECYEGNFDAQANNVTGYSKRCKKCRTEWHKNNRERLESTANNDYFNEVNAKELTQKQDRDWETKFPS